MRKTARKTDIAIILVVIATIIFFCFRTQNHVSESQSAPVTVDSYNGKTFGVMPGSASEAVVAERFDESALSG